MKIENRINEQIRFNNVRLIGPDGEKIGIVSIYEARKIAGDNDMDLVEINPNSNPPVCKIMDFGKYKFQQEKKDKENKQVVVKTKEIIFHPNISEHDYSYRLKQAKEFLNHGNKVKATICYRGREINYINNGEKILNKLISDLNGLGIVESNSFEGKNQSIIMRKV